MFLRLSGVYANALRTKRTVSETVWGVRESRARPKQCFVLFFVCFVFGGPGGGFGDPGGGFLLGSLSSGFATTFTTT